METTVCNLPTAKNFGNAFLKYIFFLAPNINILCLRILKTDQQHY